MHTGMQHEHVRACPADEKLGKVNGAKGCVSSKTAALLVQARLSKLVMTRPAYEATVICEGFHTPVGWAQSQMMSNATCGLIASCTLAGLAMYGSPHGRA